MAMELKSLLLGSEKDFGASKDVKLVEKFMCQILTSYLNFWENDNLQENCVGGRKKITKRIILESVIIGAGPISTPLISKVEASWYACYSRCLLAIYKCVIPMRIYILLFDCNIDIVRVTEK
ncbi:hypothetical protein GQX74_010148 [Glossina fuscipes]|nr:hypothetical protein GQX74_010148 [Glossina fuscipes]